MVEFQEHLNSQCDSIKFTLEKEEDNSLPFLDVLITKKTDGSLSHQVYRKKTHTNRYLHADSHHYPSQKSGIINTLATRAWRVLDADHIKEELKHLRTSFINNGYTGKEIDKVFRNIKRNKGETKEKDKKLLKNHPSLYPWHYK